MQALFRTACILGWSDLVEILLKSPHVDPGDRVGICVAVHYGHEKVVRKLLADPRVVVKHRDLHITAMKGYPGVIRCLMGQPYIDPASFENNALTNAIEHGQVDVVRILLTDPRVGQAGIPYLPYCLLETDMMDFLDAFTPINEFRKTVRPWTLHRRCLGYLATWIKHPRQTSWLKANLPRGSVVK
jgi:hypothetical protein